MSKLSRGLNNVTREYIDSIKPFCNSRGDAKVILVFDSFPNWLFKATLNVQQSRKLGVLLVQLSIAYISVAPPLYRLVVFYRPYVWYGKVPRLGEGLGMTQARS